MAVTNQVQQVSGIRIMVRPLARRSSVVTMKFSAPSSEAMQKTAIDASHRSWPMPGSVASGKALSGG